ncbi:alternative ribosome rescue aminoacyl-tRNA hydrolase ArfB [Christiangramia sp. OXR-203]|jgi:ribosome-associated protein|uniref:alternative ribosome rescue aminoacyl-tRNA hydrolase ArfB n=1 Tax=Christiangramia sp. OXR-203 TaxID=3100176 RepID=UPI002AC980C7|nr:alternative ribosome rescue aminoacyl-tRNA hydrolase ArfB [Christiangramia sp. OXR-203]WPY98960.1 alternative ribosome rescue aminoacyl-tRNA hydrolase ArfB [Christiangramia sp. OXR-203]
MDQHQIETELEFKAVRSSGPGGQHANKTSTKVELSFHVENSIGLSEAEKGRIRRKLENRINREGFLKMSSEDSRSQHSNREIVIHNFLELIKSALKRQKPRKKTKPTRASKLKRLHSKKKRSEIKANRKDPLK